MALSKRLAVIHGLALFAAITLSTVAESFGEDGADSIAYNTYCIVCHGPDGSGVEGLGVSLTDSQLIRGSTEEEIISFLRAGRMPDDPDTVSGRPMPGFDYLPEEELMQIASYLKQD